MGIRLTALGKYLDQPALFKKLNAAVPVALTLAAAGYGTYDTLKAPKNERKRKAIANALILVFTIGSALIATRGIKIKGKDLFTPLIEHPHLHGHDIDSVLEKVKSPEIRGLINNVKNDKLLGYGRVKTLIEGLAEVFGKERVIQKVIPDAHVHKPFVELKNLSLIGLIPVLGGIAGGILSDRVNKENWRAKAPNKIKEGTYQYLNNIFLCNVGAGIAMSVLNKLNVKSMAVRFAGMLAGVVLVGLVAGSAIANFVSNNFISPLLDKSKTPQGFKNLNSERRPETLDVCLHIDDIASVGFLSGFKWIGPILPALYSISAYRAGIGYRNGEHDNSQHGFHNHHHHKHLR